MTTVSRLVTLSCLFVIWITGSMIVGHVVKVLDQRKRCPWPPPRRINLLGGDVWHVETNTGWKISVSTWPPPKRRVPDQLVVMDCPLDDEVTAVFMWFGNWPTPDPTTRVA